MQEGLARSEENLGEDRGLDPRRNPKHVSVTNQEHAKNNET